jgi:cytolysin (calcineurin-like family phosphatase)
VSDWAADMMAKPAFKVAMEKTSVNLVNVSVGQLGFTKATLLRDIYARAIELGLSLCPAEVGPQLRLQYADQPSGEWLRVAMKAITASDGRPSIFFVAAHGGGERWLSAGWGSSGDTWAPDDRFVFGKNSKSGTT